MKTAHSRHSRSPRAPRVDESAVGPAKADFVVRPDDFNASTNALVWKQIG